MISHRLHHAAFQSLPFISKKCDDMDDRRQKQLKPIRVQSALRTVLVCCTCACLLYLFALRSSRSRQLEVKKEYTTTDSAASPSSNSTDASLALHMLSVPSSTKASRTSKIEAPEGQINVLVLRQDGDGVVLPDYASFHWVLVEQSSLLLQPAQETLHRIFAASRPGLVLSIGGDRQAWKALGVEAMPLQFRHLWVHLDDAASLSEEFLTRSFLVMAERKSNSSADNNPLISVVTSAYCSGDKIQRAYQSLVAQTYDHWEWILWDDSPDDNGTYAMLQAMADNDLRLKVYKAPRRSGSIGEMKFRGMSLAQGAWLVELDHDDRIEPRLLEWIREIALSRPSTKFIYSDHAELYEGEDAPSTYGDYYGFFFASYTRQHVRSHANGPLQAQYISRAPWLNPVTVQHLVGLPNHVRIWNRAFYEDVGRHRGHLPVADDYDLLVRTFLHAHPGEIVCIAYPSYFQYRNKGANNFTVKRNALIQQLVRYLYGVFKVQLLNKYKALGWNGEYPNPGTGVWETTLADVEPRMEYYFVPEDQNPEHPCVSIVLYAVASRPDFRSYIEKAIDSIVQQTHTNWKLYLIGDGCPELDNFASEALPHVFPQHLDKIAWYNLERAHNDEGRTAKNYALKMIIKTKWVTYMDAAVNVAVAWDPQHLEVLLHECTSKGTPYCLLPASNSSGEGAERARPGLTSYLMHSVEFARERGYWHDNATAYAAFV